MSKNSQTTTPLVVGLERRVGGETLHLHLRFEYFDDIAQGRKYKEYRDSAKWKKKLDSGKYKWIRLYRGFEKVAPDTILDMPYRGYELETIVHPHFGNVATLVCSIHITPNV